MVLIKTARYEKFLREAGDRRIICFGAGGAFEKFIRLNEHRTEMLNRIDLILDNNEALAQTAKNISGRVVPIKTVPMMLENGLDPENTVIILTTQYVAQVASQLDSIPLFDQAACYTGSSISIDSGTFASAVGQISGNYAIPKVIHYCWLGGKEMPDLERSCVDSWKRYCPDYEFILWNEDNYDIRRCKYMSDAYDAKKWGFVPDYAPLVIIYRYGGVYFDTDVELLRNIDDFLQFKAFFSFESSNHVAPGLGFGSIAGNELLKEMLDEYETYSFINENGSLNMTPSPVYATNYFKNFGFNIYNKTQVLNDIVLLSSDYFCPMNQGSAIYELTDNTYALHKFSGSWLDKNLRDEVNELREKVADINKQLLKTWKKDVIKEVST